MKTLKKAQKDLRAGKSPTTAAGEFVHEEIEHVREGKHGARSTKQAIAIGLSKARRAGVPLPPPKRGQTSERTRESAKRAYEVGQGERKPRGTSPRRGRAMRKALEREPKSVASKAALSRQATSVARRRSKSASTRKKARSKSASTGTGAHKSRATGTRARSKATSTATRTTRKSGSARGRSGRSDERS